MAIGNFELNWLSFLKVEPCDTFLSNTTVAALFFKIFGWEMIIKNDERFVQVAYFCLLLFIFIVIFLMKLHPCPLLLLIYFASNSSIPGIDFFLEKSLPYRYA